MLIELTESCLQSLESEKENLMNILLSYKNGNHIVMFEKRSMYKKITPIYNDENTVLMILQNVYNKHNENKNMQKLLKTVIKVVGSDQIIKKNSMNGKLFFEVPLSHFSNFIKESIFITENSSDAKCYICLTKRAQKEKFLNIPNVIKFKSLNIPGGGSETFKVYEDHSISNEALVLCICDSDKECESSYEGNTFQNVLSAEERLNETNHITKIHVLGVREKENLIPPEYYLYHPAFYNNEVLKKLIGRDDIFRFMKLSDSDTHLDKKLMLELGIKENKGKGIRKNGFKEWINYVLEKDCPYIHIEQSESPVKVENFEFFKGLPDYLKIEHDKLLQSCVDWTCTYGKMRASL